MPMRLSRFFIFPLMSIGILLLVALTGIKPAAAKPHKIPSLTLVKAPSAEALFVKVLQSDDLFSYKGRQITTYWRTGRAVEVMVYHNPPDDHRIEYLNPEMARGRLLVSDGLQQWEYDPHQKVLRLRRLSPGALDDDDLLSYTLLRANYLLAVDPKPRTWAERKAYLVTIKRPKGATLARRFWIDAGSGLILKREIYGEDGKLAVTVTFSDITYHPTLDSTLFSLASLAKTIHTVELPSAETAVPMTFLQKQLAGKASAPGSLAGYRLVGATTTKIGERPVLHLRYSDGLNLVSLFEQRRTQPQRPTLVPAGMRVTQIGSIPVHISHRASLTTLNWDTSTLNTTLMGEMGISSLQTLAQAAIQGH
ncbi:MAG: sigma-E factor regulatory protein RseB domain-containing protein [Janthinobacterium lividum]